MSSKEFYNQQTYSGAVAILRYFFEKGIISKEEFISSELKIRAELSPLIPIVSSCINLN